MGKIQNTESQGNSFGGFLKFAHLNLFRISDFVLRILTLNLAPWRAQHLTSAPPDIESVSRRERQGGGGGQELSAALNISRPGAGQVALGGQQIYHRR